ncbi:MAG: CDP-alcohol phosphatidyltransferase family protein [Balneola sp.]
MISIYKIKPAFQKLLVPVLRMLHKIGFTANQITISSILLSAIIGVSFWYADIAIWLFLTLPIGLLLRMALNALDGMMARTYNQQSKLGEMLNEAGDIISDLIIYFPLIKYFSGQTYVVILFLCLSIINEFAGLLGKAMGSERRYDGPMGKSDRAFVVSIIGILLFFQINIQNYALYGFSIINFLLILSTYKRLTGTLKHD